MCVYVHVRSPYTRITRGEAPQRARRRDGESLSIHLSASLLARPISRASLSGVPARSTHSHRTQMHVHRETDGKRNARMHMRLRARARAHALRNVGGGLDRSGCFKRRAEIRRILSTGRFLSRFLFPPSPSVHAFSSIFPLMKPRSDHTLVRLFIRWRILSARLDDPRTRCRDSVELLMPRLSLFFFLRLAFSLSTLRE